MSTDGRRVEVRDGGRLVAAVDTRTFDVREPVAAVPPRRAVAQSTDAGDLLWAALALVAAAAGLAALIARRRGHARLGRRVSPRA